MYFIYILNLLSVKAKTPHHNQQQLPARVTLEWRSNSKRKGLYA